MNETSGEDHAAGRRKRVVVLHLPSSYATYPTIYQFLKIKLLKSSRLVNLRFSSVL